MENDILEDVFNEEPPDTLYHYTNLEGLMGIIQDKAIWATHTQYLNDTKEYTLALGLIRDEIILIIIFFLLILMT